CEPFERVQIDVPEEFAGTVIEALGKRKGEMIDMSSAGDGQVRLEFIAPSRGLIGYMTEFLTQTRGYGIINRSFDSYRPIIANFRSGRRQGVLVAQESGKVTQYSLIQLEDRGTMFVEPGTEVYEGMIVGEHNRENDLTVNVVKEKQLTNMRSATKEHTVALKKSRKMSL